MSGGDGMDDLRGAAGDEWLDGGDGADWLSGGDGDDILEGYWSPGAATGGYDLNDSYDPDLLRGEDGNDLVFGGSGDTLIGGAGTDTFVTGTWVDSDHAVEIGDFEEGQDQIVVTHFDSYGGPGVVDLETEGDDVHVLFDGATVARVTNGAGTVTLGDVSVIAVDAPV